MSGVLLALAFPPLNLWWLVWVALIPLAVAVAMSDRILEPLVGALIGGAVFHLLGLDWIRTSYESSGLSGPWAFAWLAVAMAAAPTWCLMVAVMHALYWRFSVGAGIALPLGWMAGDLTRRTIALVTTGMDFPWLQLAAPQTAYPVLVQAADILGATGMGGILALVTGTLCDFLLARGTKARVGAACASTIVIAAILTYGVWRLGQPVSQLGPAIALFPISSLDKAVHDGSSLPRTADILLWPEGAVQDDNSADSDHPLGPIEDVAERANTLVVVGWYRKRPRYIANSIAIVHPQDGLVQLYDKTYLVPWSEFRPTVGFPSIDKIARHRTFECGNARVATCICYDICFPGLFRQFDSPDLFMVSSAEALDQRMHMQQHVLQMARLRAVEFRRPIVRNVDGGHSGIIDGSGRLAADLVNLREPIVVGPVPLDGRWSLYRAVGDWILLLPLALAGLLLSYTKNRLKIGRHPQRPSTTRGDPTS